MAYGDYHCCAVCEGKMAYITDAGTKGRMCLDCAIDLSFEVSPTKVTSELVQCMECDAVQSVKVVRSGFGFRTCYYSNDVARAYREISKRLPAPEQQEGLNVVRAIVEEIKQ